MTITAIAKQLNVTTMTIYRRLKKAGINLDDLRDAATGEITAAGASTIAALFDATGTTCDGKQAQQVTTDVATGDTTGHQTGAAVTIAVLEAKLDAAQDTIARLEGERDRLLKQLEAATAALEREQADRQHERLLLTASTAGAASMNGSEDGSGQQRGGWWFRLWHGGK